MSSIEADLERSVALAKNGATGRELAQLRRDEYAGLQMAIAPAEAKRRHQELMAFVAAVMTPGVDYGRIPGTDKDCLFQPGAQKLCEVYGFAWEFSDVTSTEDWDKPFFLYRRRCVLTSRRDGSYVGDGRGSCNSREDRYAWRWLWELPRGVDRATVKTRTTRNGKTQYRFANEDIYSLVNTLEKMACKRALVHAVIGATRSSGAFTQDAEDLPAEAFGRPEAHRSWDAPAPPESGPSVVDAEPAGRPTLEEVLSLIEAAPTRAALSEVGKLIAKHSAYWRATEQIEALRAASKAKAASFDDAEVA